MRIAALADIHANVVALEAVLEDLYHARINPDIIVVAGDLSHRFPWPRETYERLAEIDHLVVFGNSEVYMATYGTPDWPAHLPTSSATIDRLVNWYRRRLGSVWLDYISQLPGTIRIPDTDITMTHAIPGNPFVGIAPINNTGQWTALRTNAELDAGLGTLDTGLLICGHTHYAMLRHWHNTLIVNPGPVCCVHHGQEAQLAEGAQYAVIDWQGQGKPWRVEYRHIPFDVTRVVKRLQDDSDSIPWIQWKRDAEGLARINRPPGESQPTGTRLVMTNDDYDERLF